MPQGISPNPLNKISEVYLSQISEHHKKDADGNTIPHEDELNEVSSKTLRNYIIKGTKDVAKRASDPESDSGPKYGKKMSRMDGVSMAADKLAKKASKNEEVEFDEAKKPMVKVKLKDPSKIKVKVTDIGPGGKEYVRKNEMDEAMAMRPSNMKKKAKLGAALDRLQALKVAKKKKEMGEEIENEGMQYGIFKGDGKPKGAMAAFGKKDKAKKDKKIKMEALSNWKEDYVWEADEEQMEKEVKEKKVKNKIIINPKLGEAVEELGGQLLDVQEMSGAQGAKEDDPQLKSKMLRQRQLKKQVLLRKLQAVRQTGGEDIVASYEPEGEQVDENIINKIKQALNKFRNNPKGKIVVPGGNTIPTAGSREKEINDLLNQEYEPEGEQLDEYGNPRVGARLRVARAIDRVNPKPKVGSKRTAISNKLKMSAIKAETKRREQKENPYSVGKKVRMALGMSNEDYIPEEGYDILRDMGKIPPTRDKKDATTMPRSSQPQKPAGGKSALDIVKADIRKKYGKGAIMDLGKK